MLAAGIDPALVLRLGLAPGADERTLIERLEEAGLQVVAMEPDRKAVVAFRHDVDLRGFHEAIAGYERGPAEGRKTSKWDVLEYIEPSEVRAWSRPDRLGPRLRAAGEAVEFDPSADHKLDVELWYPGHRENARRALEKLQHFVAGARDRGAAVNDTYLGDALCLARVTLRGEDVDRLLEMPEVAEIDLPPRFVFDRLSEDTALRQTFDPPASPPADGPRICILDSGITANHPLLRAFVKDASCFHSALTSAADEEGHGTAVASVAVYGDLRRHVNARSFESSVSIFSARLLDDENQADPDRLVVTQIREAVELYSAPPFNCRVFNLSFGDYETFLEKTGGRQGPKAQVLDELARAHDVVFVVSAGNVPVATTHTGEAESLRAGAGGHIFEPPHRLVDPATSAIALTVGAIAGRAERPLPRAGEARSPLIASPLANAGHPAPFTRVGPGVCGAIKPDLVEDGGNLLWSGTGGLGRVAADEASSVLLLSNRYQPRRGWFRYDVGTSFAAPRVARTAAMAEHSLRVDTGTSPSANLIRAVVGAGAVPIDDLDGAFGAGATVTATGYGRLDEDFALWSSDERVVMFAEDALPLDHFALFEIPVPTEFLRARGRKAVTVSLAYDPPVRSRRSEYLGIAMDTYLYAGAPQELLFEFFRTRKKDEERRPDVDRFACKMEPRSTRHPERGWARAQSTLQVGRFSFQRRERAGDSWWLVVRARRRWAPLEVERQRYAIVVVLESSCPDLYSRVQARLRTRTRARV